jgi:hypothetical protein
LHLSFQTLPSSPLLLSHISLLMLLYSPFHFLSLFSNTSLFSPSHFPPLFSIMLFYFSPPLSHLCFSNTSLVYPSTFPPLFSNASLFSLPLPHLYFQTLPPSLHPLSHLSFLVHLYSPFQFPTSLFKHFPLLPFSFPTFFSMLLSPPFPFPTSPSNTFLFYHSPFPPHSQNLQILISAHLHYTTCFHTLLSFPFPNNLFQQIFLPFPFPTCLQSPFSTFLFSPPLSSLYGVFSHTYLLKVPKCEIFDPFFFTSINPIWVGDLRTGEKKIYCRRPRQIFAILFFLRRLSLR